MSIYCEEDFERALKRLKERSDVLPENKRDIAAFLKFMKSMGRGAHRRLRYLQNLTTLSKLLGKPFKDANRKDFEALLGRVKEGKENGKSYSKNTESNFNIEIKRFMAWLRDTEKGQYPKEVAWLECGGSVRRNLERDELLTEEDVKKLIHFAVSLRNKTAIALLYQTGMRPTELLDLRVKDFFNEAGTYGVDVQGTKTKAAKRRIPLIDDETIKLVKAWLAVHPNKDKPDFKESSLWASIVDEPLNYFAFRKFLRKVVKKSGINKPSFAYLFRHTRASLWANDPRITRSQLCYLMGWTQSSKVVDTYLHTNEKDIFNSFSKMKATDPKSVEAELEALGDEMNAVSLEKNKELVKVIMTSWRKFTPDLFKQFVALGQQNVNLTVLKTRGQGLSKTAKLTRRRPRLRH